MDKINLISLAQEIIDGRRLNKNDDLSFFIDCDLEELGSGVDGFLKCEEDALLSICAESTVIATGGSAVYSQAAMERFAENSDIVYLEVPLDALKKRLKNIKERGVVLRNGESLEEMFENRTKLYDKYADIKVVEEGISIEETVQAVIEKLKSSR